MREFLSGVMLGFVIGALVMAWVVDRPWFEKLK